MSAILAIIAQLLPLINSLTPGVIHLVQWIATIRTAAIQSKEWTPELDRAFIASLYATIFDPAWQQDSKN